MSSAASKIASKLPPAVRAATDAASIAAAAKSPQSVLSIPSSIRHGPISVNSIHINDNDNDNDNGNGNATNRSRSPAAVTTSIGPTRRIFLLDPHMTGDEMDGLAHRIQMFGKNPSLNCILLSNNLQANSDDDVDYTLPSSALSGVQRANVDPFVEDASSPEGRNEVWNVAAGYDARSLVDTEPHEKMYVLDSMMKLARSVKGGKPMAHTNANANANAAKRNDTQQYVSKIPFISIPHGSISDGGYALAMGSYVLATPDSRFGISNPSRGLSLDPIGLSYILPRLGHEFTQPCAAYSLSLGNILALTGYRANGDDMVESGLATHFLDGAQVVGSLEQALAELPSYDHQVLKRSQVRHYGDMIDVDADQSNNGSRNNSNRFHRDVNAQYRNVAVGNLIHSTSSYDATGLGYANVDTQALFFQKEDPSLVLESERNNFILERESVLLSVAATFEDVFQKEDSIEGIVERMNELASITPTNAEETEFVSLAKELRDGMAVQSPLALHAVHKLLTIGKHKKETLEKCMMRERGVQLKLLEKEDYINWARSGMDEGEFRGWKHKSVSEVTQDEVKELFAE